jgi:hypothetical protein
MATQAQAPAAATNSLNNPDAPMRKLLAEALPVPNRCS